MVTCFFAREDTKTPLYISIISVIINVVLSLLLIGSMREMGIALATAISAWVNAMLLFLILYFKKNLILDNQLFMRSFKIIISVIIMVIACYFLNNFLFSNILDLNTFIKILILLIIIGGSKIIYLAMIFMLKVLTIDDLKRYMRK